MTHHTPGPWSLMNRKRHIGARNKMIATIGPRGTEWCPFTREDEHNALLIAAAPELLVALKHTTAEL